MQKIQFPWGRELLEVDVPEHWSILGELKPIQSDSVTDIATSCTQALMSPIGSPGIAERDLRNSRITIVCDDHSRPTPVVQFIKPVLNHLFNAGALQENIRILIASGVHRPSTEEELVKKLGADILSTFQVKCHDAYDQGGLVSIGTTSRGTKVAVNSDLPESDFIVCLGSIEPHLLLGFGGGLKMLVPGCASAETIGSNHLQGVGGTIFDYVGVQGHNSPMRLDLEEAAGLLRKDIFIVNASMNEHAVPVKFFCGDPIAAQRSAEKFIQSHMNLEVPEQADLVMTNSYPMEADLRQSIKCVGNTIYACKPGGVMLGFLKCETGVGEIPMNRKNPPYGLLRFILQMLGEKRILPLVQKLKKHEPAEETFISHFGLQMLKRNHLGIFSDSPLLPEDLGRRVGLATSFTKITDGLSWASKFLPKNPKVWVVPYGGSSYVSTPEII